MATKSNNILVDEGGKSRNKHLQEERIQIFIWKEIYMINPKNEY